MAVEPDFRVPSLNEAIDVIERALHPVDDAAEPETESAPAAVAVEPPATAVSAELPAPVAASPTTSPVDPALLAALQSTAEQILAAVEWIAEQVTPAAKAAGSNNADSPAVAPFSFSRMSAGAIQVIALAAAGCAYATRGNIGAAQTWLLAAIFLQLFTLALLQMRW